MNDEPTDGARSPTNETWSAADGTRSSADGTGSAAGTPHTGDPLAIRSIAVTLDDAVTALEARLRTGREAVIRLTPPFAGRMRARLHVAGAGEEVGSPAPIHVDPAALFASVPAYPTPDGTAARLEDPAATNSETHREKHADRLAGWRQRVRDRRAEETTIETPQGPLDVRVLWLGQ